MWWEIPVEDEKDQTKQDLMKGCGYALMPFVLKSVVKAGWVGASEINEMRKETARTVAEIGSRIVMIEQQKADGNLIEYQLPEGEND